MNAPMSVNGGPGAEVGPETGERLEILVRDVMTAGILVVPEDASVLQAHRAMLSHGVHAVLVVGSSDGTPLGWITARGLLGWMDSDIDIAPCSEAITEPPQAVAPTDTAREALTRLLAANVTHLLVCRAPGALPEGVVSDLDLARLASR